MPDSNVSFNRKSLTLFFLFLFFHLKDSMKPTITNYTNIENSFWGANPPSRNKISLSIVFYLLIIKKKREKRFTSLILRKTHT